MLLALLGCSYDAKRENPLGPELTPEVSVGETINNGN
jgi:hypothetical protein